MLRLEKSENIVTLLTCIADSGMAYNYKDHKKNLIFGTIDKFDEYQI